MAGQKKRTSETSRGLKSSINKRREEKRQERFKAKREAGNAYQYKSNPYKKDTPKWIEENVIRAEKAKSSRLPYARLVSFFAKVDNEVKNKKELAKTKAKPRKEK